MATTRPPEGARRFLVDDGGIAGLPTSVLDSAVYRDEGRYQLELDRVFADCWFLVDHLSSWPEAGDYRVWEGFGQTVVIARRGDGELAAFHNVCQHRGPRIVDGDGHCPSNRLVCPWHGFVYDLEGTVVGVPDRNRFDPASLAGLRAPRVAVEELAGFVWINLAGDGAEPLESYLEGVHGEIEWFHMDRWRLIGHATYDVAANWKHVVDGFNESWHQDMTHRNTLDGGIQVQKSMFRLYDKHSMMAIPLDSVDLDQIDGPIDHRRHGVSHYLAFPCTIFNFFPTHGLIFRVLPRGVDACRLDTWMLCQPEPPEGRTADGWERYMTSGWRHLDDVVQEDVFVAQEAARAVRSLGYRRSLLAEHECRIMHFHRLLDRILGTPVSVRAPS